MPILGLLKNRGFQYAILVACVWHLFWFFAVHIDVNAKTQKTPQDLKIYFVGPVLSDDAFNMMVALKPELSQTQYSVPDSFTESLEPEQGRLGRHEPGDLVSVPLGRTTWSALSGLLGNDKPYADTDFYQRFSIDLMKSPFRIEGELKDREILHLPDLPKRPADLNFDKTATLDKGQFELTVDASGQVTRVETLISNGDPEIDLLWNRYLKEWQFMPLEAQAGDRVQQGEVHVSLEALGES